MTKKSNGHTIGKNNFDHSVDLSSIPNTFVFHANACELCLNSLQVQTVIELLNLKQTTSRSVYRYDVIIHKNLVRLCIELRVEKIILCSWIWTQLFDYLIFKRKKTCHVHRSYNYEKYTTVTFIHNVRTLVPSLFRPNFVSEFTYRTISCRTINL